jgi:hypothetical protein
MIGTQIGDEEVGTAKPRAKIREAGELDTRMQILREEHVLVFTLCKRHEALRRDA